MPKTRSQNAEDKALKVYEDFPASPSENAPISTEPRSTEQAATDMHEPERRPSPNVGATTRTTRAPSVRSNRSTASAIARVRQAELAAEEQLAEIKRQELELQATLIKKKLAADVALIREQETDRESLCAEEIDTEKRVSDWLQRTHIRGERERIDADRSRSPPPPPTTTIERYPTTTPNRVTFNARRSTSPTPAKSKERGIDRLADTLEKIARSRAPPRQTQDLPLFSGVTGEWLPFKAAMQESTNIHGFSPAENLARLRACLRGQARQTVSALLFAASDPTTIMKTLEQCYGRPEMIIDNALEEIKRLPRLGTSANELNAFAIKLQNIVTVITCLDEKGYLKNPMLTRHVTEKLSPHIRSRWCDYAEEFGNRHDPEIITLSQFLMREADRTVRHAYTTSSAIMTPGNNKSAQREQRYRPQEQRRANPVYTTTEDTQEKKYVCYCCGSEHETIKCDKLTKMTVPQRWQWAKESRICFVCLNSKHRRYKCRAKKCGRDECRLPHHALLHLNKESEETVITASTHTSTQRKQVLLKVCPVTIKGENDREINTYALLDEGSTITLIDQNLADTIGIDGPVRPLNIHGVSSSQREPRSRAVELKVKGRNGTAYHQISARTVSNLRLGSHTVPSDIFKYPHLQELKPEDVMYELARPQILIGADQWPLIVTRKLLAGKRNQPAASYTQLGWIIHGSMPRGVITEDHGSTLHIRASQHAEEKDRELSDLVKSHYEIDALGIAKIDRPVAKEERAVSIFNNTVKKIKGRFEAGLPWIDDEVKLPPSYDMALQRLRGIERKMDRSPAFSEAYTQQIEQLLSKGYAEYSDDNKTTNSRSWYLPHFAVTNPNKPGKVRLVFDAAAKANGTCLNDALLDGPDLLQNLQGILFRFRSEPVAVTADIREMFLQIKIRKEDQPAQQFLWRGKDRTQPPTKFVMTSMIFGARSSPFMAHSVRDKNATDHQNSHPVAYASITQSHYMDDWVESFETTEKAARAIREVQDVHEKAGFKLASWSTSHKDLIMNVAKDEIADSPKELGRNTNPYEKTLGILWMANTDELAFNTLMPRVHEEVKNKLRTPTKREALGAVMSIFDPLGLLSPYTITAKIMLQGLWKKKVNWDDPLPSEEATLFEEWQDDLAHINKLRLPRCYERDGSISKRELHVFCDASEQAYAIAAYWRLTRWNGDVSVILIAGKAKVAPLKMMSIPRMELQAALIGARLAATIIKEHRKEAETTLWTDSRTVLQWVKSEPVRYTPYVAHRLAEIAELTKPDQWKWVPTSQNVADDATRAGNTRLTRNDRWFTGPKFLRQPKERWPENISIETTVATNTLIGDEQPTLINIKKFSSYERLTRTMAYVLLFIDKCRNKTKDGLSLEIMKRAERELLRISQKESFPEEIIRLRKLKTIGRNSRLYRLDPKYGADKLIRLNGRINAASVPEEMKEPPILDGSHPLARLIIKKEHEKHSHVGREQIVNNLRLNYWILRLRPAVRGVLRDCVECKIRRALPKTPVKGDLPKSRMNAYTRPFSHTGVDCFGPMWVVIGRRREKRWGMIFTCLTTRAVHIETINSLSTDSAIMAMRRMAARRGWPERFISDNGTNFHGAEMELKAAYKEWLPTLREYAIMQRVDWRYIDPGAPNQGGAWERLIRSVKAALAVTLKEKAPKEEILSTAMAEIEHTINSRPLTHVPVEPTDREALTPNHFLLGTATGLPYVGQAKDTDRKTWKVTQALANTFWERWVNEYLPTLNPRDDARRRHRSICEGDVVIIADGLLPRNVWPKGQVQKIYTGPDGVVRSADVRTRGGTFRRPVRRLVVLQEKGCEDLRRGETVADNKLVITN